ncbi:hypothetical protein N7541_002651 [Penicillium brevicompactum]|uniref:FAS1 domain-containing protein n=1 Tax=Penicillium brevicompactum TaxID=5074 RepID=A0A9W9RK90_PENBR|nr:hypothetical protein N7541_002651 [Penicillium brevicompactum]
MRAILLLTVTSLASALVIPDGDMIADLQPHKQLVDQDGGLDLSPWWAINPLNDEECPMHFDWSAESTSFENWSKNNCPWDNESSPGKWFKEEQWPGHDEHPGRGRWPGDDHGHGEWPGHGDRPHHPPRYRPHPIHGPGHKPGRCPGPQCLTDKTTWEAIQQIEQTSRLAELIGNDKDLVELLSKNENYTIFAPTNQALRQLRHIPEDAISNFLRYHIVPGRVHLHELAFHQTLPTELNETSLGNLPQRILIDRDEEVFLNRKSMVRRAEIVTNNGVIHTIDSPLFPPPDTRALIPEYSIFAQALTQAKLNHHMDPANRSGGTTFVPTNGAFRRLGRGANEFLFSKEGADCLRSLIEYHVVVNRTLFPDVLYTDGKAKELFADSRHAVVEMETVEGREVRVDVEVGMRINGFSRVVENLLARDGSVLMLERVLIPPRKVKNKGGNEEEKWNLKLVDELDCDHEHEL